MALKFAIRNQISFNVIATVCYVYIVIVIVVSFDVFENSINRKIFTSFLVSTLKCTKRDIGRVASKNAANIRNSSFQWNDVHIEKKKRIPISKSNRSER